ncbi:MAG: GTP-binding protein [Candidatus Adiutrix sp.]|nr:GTP-binding protein [Candidatus Adiutrix sp.]
MLNKKICMLGSMAVGKTSLIRRFVDSLFSDDYLSTVGVKISKKNLALDGRELNMMLWDLEGQDDYGDINTSYLKGASGLLLVIDGTRGSTLTQALEMRESALKVAGAGTPHLFLINKTDLRSEWQVSDAVLGALRDKGCEVLEVSAKTGENVEKAFELIAKLMLETV